MIDGGNVQIIPALPGNFILCDDLTNGVLCKSEPILAWAIEYHKSLIDGTIGYHTVPVTLSGCSDEAVLHASGEVEYNYEMFCSLDEANKEYKRINLKE